MIRLQSIFLLTLTFSLYADDWPQWLGPERDSVWREKNIMKVFPSGGPTVRWRATVGGGYSGPSVANGRVYLMDRKPARSSEPAAKDDAAKHAQILGTERVLCLSEKTGATIWMHEYDCPYDISYAGGPRVTPLVCDGKVYTVGAMGNLLCLDAANGDVLWAHDYKTDYHTSIAAWGSASHPLIDGDRLICVVGGRDSVAVAFHKDTGKEIWRSLSAREPGYCTPVMITTSGTRQLIVWHPEAVNSLNPETGDVRWSYPWEMPMGLSIVTPRVSGDRLLISSVYKSSKCFKLDGAKSEPELAWEGKNYTEKKTDTLHCLISTPFIEDGYIYGVCNYGQLRCLKLETGERVWETFAATTSGDPVPWANAFIVKNEERFFLANEHGDLIIAMLTPKGYDEQGRAHLLDATNADPHRLVVWSHPAFANRCVFWRNDKEIVCVSLEEAQ